MKPKKTRKTLNERINAAPTHADKWETALTGGPPLTPIQQLAFDAFPLRLPVGNGMEWKKNLIERLKARFAENLFPALMADDIMPFEELIDAMGDSKKAGGSVSNFNRGIMVNPGVRIPGKDAFQFIPRTPVNKEKGRKKEAGRLLRLALLSLDPEDRQSVKTVLAALDRNQVEYSDESHVRCVMRELDVRLLLPRQKLQWFFRGKLVRELCICENGKFVNRGMSANEVSSLPHNSATIEPVLVRELIPKPDK